MSAKRYYIKRGEQIIAEIFADSHEDALTVYAREEGDVTGLKAVRAYLSGARPDFDPHTDYPERYTDGRPV